MKFLLPFICGIMIFSCKPAIQRDVKELFYIDRKFSESAGEIGFNKAFINFAHSDAVLLRKNSMVARPINWAK